MSSGGRGDQQHLPGYEGERGWILPDPDISSRLPFRMPYQLPFLGHPMSSFSPPRLPWDLGWAAVLAPNRFWPVGGPPLP